MQADLDCGGQEAVTEIQHLGSGRMMKMPGWLALLFRKPRATSTANCNAPQSLPVRCVITVHKVTHGTATLLALHSADNVTDTHTLAIVAIPAIEPG